jgi:hypothetical protein
MTSPYLHRQRPVREIIERLITVREAELLQTADDSARLRIEDALDWLRDELARLGGGSEFDGRA